MAERLTSPEEAKELQGVLRAAVADLERRGFGIGQIGASMVGMGAALSQSGDGNRMALDVLEGARDGIMRSDLAH